MEKELIIPEIAQNDPNAIEVVRVWVAKGGQHVSIDVGVWKDPIAWGIVLADLAGHVANAYEQETGKNKKKTLAQIRELFNKELDTPTDVPRGNVRNQ
jgi:hypothetical protein